MNFGIDAIIFMIILVINLAVGLKASRGIKTIQEYALGDRNFSTAALVATITATWISGSYFFSAVSETYANGLYYLWPVALGDVACFLIIAFIFAPRMGEFLGKLSIAEAMGDLYGKNVRIITAIAGCIGAGGIIAVQLKATGMLFEYSVGFRPELGILIGGLIITSYSAMGGIKSVTLTDMVQLFTFGTIIPALGLFLFNVIGEENSLYTLYKTKEIFDLSKVFDFSDKKSFYYLFLFFYFAIPGFDSAIFQRISMAKNTQQVTRSFAIAIFFCFSLVLMMSWIGFLVLSLHPNIDPSKAVESVLLDYAYVGLKGFIFAGIMAMVMSSVDSYINSTSVMMINDFVRLFVKKDFNALKFSRVFAFFLGIFAVTLAIKSTSILKLIITTYSFYMPIVTVPFIFSILGFRSSSKSVLIGMAAGFVTVCYWEMFMRDNSVDSVIPGMLANIIFLFGSHYLLKQPGGWVGIKSYAELNKIKKQRKAAREKLIYNLKKFSVIEFCVKNLPRHPMTYVMMAVFSLILMFSNVYFLEGGIRQENKMLLDNLYITVLAFSTIYLTYPIWPSRFQSKKFIGVTWMVGIFYILTFVSGVGVLISKFNEFHLMLLLLSLVALAMLVRWYVTIIYMVIGLSGSVIFYKFYTNFAVIDFDFGTLQFKALYILLMLSSMLLAFFKPKQDELEEERGVKIRFMKNFNHEIRTPLQNIYSSTEILHESWERLNEERKRFFVKGFYDGNKRLYALMSNMLDLAALEQNKLLCKVEKNQDIILAVKDAISNYQDHANAKEQFIYFESNESSMLVDMDYVKIVQAVGNLLSNAIRYSDKGEDIRVSVKREGEEVRIEVRDGGIGIEEEEKEKILEPFMEGKRTASQAGGVGIGLTFAKYIVDRHKGRLECRNNHPEKGATFSIIIPIKQETN